MDYYYQDRVMEDKKKYILITGVAGLIGSNFADYVSENHKEYGIIGVDNLFGGYIENVNDNVMLFQRDLSDDYIDDLFYVYDIEYVFHFAAYAAEGLSPFMRMFNWKNNSVATANIINCCIKYKVKRLVYTSSMAVCGCGGFSEQDTPRPIDPYGIAKYACEMDIKVAAAQHDLDYCIIRPHNVYGEKQNIWDMYRNVLGIWMYQILHDEPITVYGDGEQIRAFTYVSDIMKPLWNAAVSENASKETINLGGTETHRLNEAVDILCDVVGYTPKIEHKESRYEVKYVIPTYHKSVELLGFENNTKLYDGLLKMWNWAKEQPNRERYKWDEYELTDGIYSYWK